MQIKRFALVVCGVYIYITNNNKMSLDVTLYNETCKSKKGSTGIFVREDGGIKEITEKEWNEKFQGKTPIVASVNESENVFEYNITHNLVEMAKYAGLYECLWSPDMINATEALQLVKHLNEGLQKLLDKPEYFKLFNPKNGWGSYEGLVKFVTEYLEACLKYPQSTIHISK